MEKLFKVLSIMMASVLCVTFVACGDDNDESDYGNESTEEWYITGNITADDFEEFSDAIENEEILSYSNSKPNYADADLFFTSNGMWTTTSHSLGRFRFAKPNGGETAVRIVDNTRLDIYSLNLWKDFGDPNPSGDSRFYHFNAGRYFGNLAYYVNTHNITVYVRNGNTLVTTEGKIFVLTSDGLVTEDGKTMKPFQPNY